MLCCNDAIELHDDYWATRDGSDATRDEAWRVGSEVPDNNRAWFDVVRIVVFNDVLDIDEPESGQRSRCYKWFASSAGN